MPHLLPLEIAVFTKTSALLAQTCGAKRIELNAPGSYDAGGLTPSVDDLTSIAAQMQIPIRIMIRPRGPPDTGSDFIYTPEEFQLMKTAISAIKATGTLNPLRGDAFVFGILEKGEDDTLEVDTTRCAELTALARPFGCIYHRAFDAIAGTDRWEEGLADLVRCGFEGLLTAGGQRPFYDNCERLEDICRRAGTQLQVVIGGGVRHHNARSIAKRLAQNSVGSIWMHSAALTNKEDQPSSEEVDPDEVIKLMTALGLEFVD